MNWRSSRFLVTAFIICVLLIIGVVLFAVLLRSNQSSTNTIPTPGDARTTYTNAQFSYTIGYPSQWYLDASSDKSQVHVFLVHDKAAPEAVAFDIMCFANTNQLDAQSVWQQTQPQDSSETGVGPMRLASGASAYIAKGQGQTAYTVYTLMKQQLACQIITYVTDSTNAKAVLDVVNSFSWQ